MARKRRTGSQHDYYVEEPKLEDIQEYYRSPISKPYLTKRDILEDDYRTALAYYSDFLTHNVVRSFEDERNLGTRQRRLRRKKLKFNPVLYGISAINPLSGFIQTIRFIKDPCKAGKSARRHLYFRAKAMGSSKTYVRKAYRRLHKCQ